MLIDNLYDLNTATHRPEVTPPSVVSRLTTSITRQVARMWCGLHGHLILLHFAPNKLSLHCALCGYESEGWEVGRPPVARRPAEQRVHSHHVRTERRRTLRAVPSGARMAS